MKNFKINKNQQPLSDADIAKRKDFSQVVNAYKAAKIPFYKMPKIWIGASAVMVASVAIFIVFAKFGAADSAQPFIAPPLASADIKTSTYVLNAQADSTIIYPSGSKIHVPANAFRDKKGNVIKGNVELHYREFKKPIDAFLAGIPMTYDSAGQQFTFETAGMMEISASQNGEGLQTNPDALLKVDILSDNADDRFNTYYLDTVEKKWKYQVQANFNPAQSIDTPQHDLITHVADTTEYPVLTKEVQSIKLVEKEIAHLEQQKPVKPIKEEKSKPRFSIKVDENEFPEIAVYKNVKFQVEDNSYKDDKAGITWSDVELKRIPGGIKYRITFISPTEKYTVIAVPVFDEQDYAPAKSTYDEKYKEYTSALAKKKADEARLKAQLLANEKERREERQQQLKQQAEQAKRDRIERQGELNEQAKEARENAKTDEDARRNAIKDAEARSREHEHNWEQTQLVYRSFRVSEFGFWNSDHPCLYPIGNSTVKLVLIDAITKKRISAQQCFQVERGRDILFNYLEDGLKKFSYNPNKQYGIWVVRADSKIAVAKYDEFKAAKRNGDELELEVNVLDKSLKTTEEVKHYLEL